MGSTGAGRMGRNRDAARSMGPNTKETTKDPTRTRLMRLMQHPQGRKPRCSLSSLLPHSLAKSLAPLEDTRRRLEACNNVHLKYRGLNPFAF